MVCLQGKVDVHDARITKTPRGPPWETRSKALEMSNETRCASSCLLSEAEQKCELMAGRSPVEWRDRNPHWWSLSDP